jgi:hypothetical protein
LPVASTSRLGTVALDCVGDEDARAATVESPIRLE